MELIKDKQARRETQNLRSELDRYKKYVESLESRLRYYDGDFGKMIGYKTDISAQEIMDRFFEIYDLLKVDRCSPEPQATPKHKLIKRQNASHA